MKLVSRIDYWVKKRGLTYKWIADQLGVTQATLSRWVNSRRYPSIHTLFELAEILDCKVDDLYEREP